MNSNYHLDIAYIAGLFDGEGSVTYKKYKEKKKSGTYDCWRISMVVDISWYKMWVKEEKSDDR
jgi:hypothetical protein